MRKNGFSLIEVTVALACAMVVLLGSSSLIQISMNSQMSSQGKFDGVQQRSELKDLVFRRVGSGGSCAADLGILGKTVALGSDVLMDPTLFNNANLTVRIKNIYLTNFKSAGSVANFPQFTAQLRLEQQLTRGLASDLVPAELGTVTIVTDQNNLVTGCNLDSGAWTPMQVCSSTQGTAPTSSTCYIDVSVGATMTCPTGTGSDSSIAHCVPASVSCYDQNLSDNFDGNVMGCTRIPASYAVHYPPLYVPPPQPDVSPSHVSTTPTGPTAAPCDCGGSSMSPGGSQLCIQGSSYDDSFFGDGSAYDDMWDVKVCNSAGLFEPANPAHYFEEEGSGVSYSWKLGTCTAYGGYKNVNGVNFAKGSCY